MAAHLNHYRMKNKFMKVKTTNDVITHVIADVIFEK